MAVRFREGFLGSLPTSGTFESMMIFRTFPFGGIYSWRKIESQELELVRYLTFLRFLKCKNSFFSQADLIQLHTLEIISDVCFCRHMFFLVFVYSSNLTRYFHDETSHQMRRSCVEASKHHIILLCRSFLSPYNSFMLGGSGSRKITVI